MTQQALPPEKLEAQRSAHPRYEIGDLTLDLGRQELRRGELEIRLPKLSFDLLVTLVRHAPNLLTLEELMDLVWPGVAVSPETVSQRVKLLRDALGDDAREPRYVEGLRGRGYRLVPAVVVQIPRAKEVAAAAGTVVQEAKPGPASAGRGAAPPPHRRLALGVFAAMAVAVALVLAGATLFGRRLTGPATGPQSVAVLPFENLSLDPSDQFLAPGIAEMVQHRLASRPELLVIASTSSFSIRESESDLREIGRRLGARYLVDGSVARAGDRLRVTAKIIDGESAAQLHALRFDRELSDLIAVEDEIAAAVVEALDLTLEPAELRAPLTGERFDAHIAYLQGHRLLASYRVADAKAAIGKFERAVALEPENPEALLGLALAQIRHAWLAAEDEQAASKRVEPLLERALDLDPSLGEAVLLLADARGDEAEFRRGLALAPNLGRGFESFANFLWQRGEVDEALRMIAHARRIDPLTARNPHLEATFLLSLGELERAESLFQRALELDPEFHPSIARLADIAAARGHWIESVKRVEQAIAMDPEAHWMRQQAAWTYLALGDIDAAADVAGEKPSVVSAWVAHERGELDRAAQLVQQLPAETRRRSTGSPELSRAIRDAGLRSGDIEGALRALESVGVDNEFADAYPDIDKLIAQAQLWRRSGREEPAREQIAAALAWLDRVPARAPWPNERRRLRATLLALQGDEPGALAALEQWASARIPLDGYVLEREPAFDAIRATPRFQALIARHRAHVARERAALEEMRARGEVPRRPAR